VLVSPQEPLWKQCEADGTEHVSNEESRKHPREYACRERECAAEFQQGDTPSRRTGKGDPELCEKARNSGVPHYEELRPTMGDEDDGHPKTENEESRIDVARAERHRRWVKGSSRTFTLPIGPSTDASLLAPQICIMRVRWRRRFPCNPPCLSPPGSSRRGSLAEFL